MRFLQRWMAVLAGGVLTAAAGCGGGGGPKSSSSNRTASGDQSSADRPLPTVAASGSSTSERVRAVVRGLGTLPFDNLTLPLVSPDGRLIATQTGNPPSWPTVLAEKGASVPARLNIEIYALDVDPPPPSAAGATASAQPPERIASVAEKALLGRNSNTHGFLIEAPQSNGTRRIGLASWLDGSVDWLANDSNVNAFAAIRPDGLLAWSRRTTTATDFELVVQGNGVEWAVSTENVSWLLPTWSSTGDQLFVFMLESSGDLYLAHGRAESADAFIQTLHRIPVARPATVEMAYQAIIGGAASCSPGARTEQIVFFDPIEQRSVLWRPEAQPNERVTFLAERSFNACVDDGPYALVSIYGELVRQHLTRTSSRASLVSGTALVARPTSSEAWPYLLLAPGDGKIGLTGMRLLAVETSTLGSSSR